MKTLADQYGIADLCAAFAVSRSGSHAWQTRWPGPCQRADVELGAHLCRVHAESRQTYGSPRLRQALRPQGHRTKPPPRAPTDAAAPPARAGTAAFCPADHGQSPRPPIALQYTVGAGGSDRAPSARVTDLTYVRTGESWL